MIKEIIICLALFDMTGVVNQQNICDNVKTLNHISKKYNIDPYTYVSILWIESNFNKKIVSYTGKACGIAQVVPKWTRPRMTCKELNSDIRISMIQGAKIFNGFKKYGGKNLKLSLCGYNQGYRCKGEKEVEKGGYDYKKNGFVYASKVIKFRKRLKRYSNKKKKAIDYYKKFLERALSSIYRL